MLENGGFRARWLVTGVWLALAGCGPPMWTSRGASAPEALETPSVASVDDRPTTLIASSTRPFGVTRVPSGPVLLQTGGQLVEVVRGRIRESIGREPTSGPYRLTGVYHGTVFAVRAGAPLGIGDMPWPEATQWARRVPAGWEGVPGSPPTRVMGWPGHRRYLAFYAAPIMQAPGLARVIDARGRVVEQEAASFERPRVFLRDIATDERGRGVAIGVCPAPVGACVQRLRDGRLGHVERLVEGCDVGRAEAFVHGEELLALWSCSDGRSFAFVHDGHGWSALELPSEQLGSVASGRDGSLWITAERDDVVHRRDGNRFEAVRVDATSSAPSIRPRYVVADDEGGAYVVLYDDARAQFELHYVRPPAATAITRMGYRSELCGSGTALLVDRTEEPSNDIGSEELALAVSEVPGVLSVGLGSCCAEGERTRCLRVYTRRPATYQIMQRVAASVRAAGGHASVIGFFGDLPEGS